jgi:hypothetical protein
LLPCVSAEEESAAFFPSEVNIVIVVSLIVWSVAVCVMDRQIMKKVDSEPIQPQKRRESIIYATDSKRKHDRDDSKGTLDSK